MLYGYWFIVFNIQGVGDDGSLFDENGNCCSLMVDVNGIIVDLY